MGFFEAAYPLIYFGGLSFLVGIVYRDDQIK
jgi:hypothetical protein